MRNKTRLAIALAALCLSFLQFNLIICSGCFLDIIRSSHQSHCQVLDGQLQAEANYVVVTAAMP